MPESKQPSPAQLYEQFLVPAIFAPWTRILLEYGAPHPGHRVLDLACGTGIVARTIAAMVAPGGKVVGIDPNPVMLENTR